MNLLKTTNRKERRAKRRNVSFIFFHTHLFSLLSSLSVKALRAFTLVELVVVLAIFTLISSVVLANHSRFNGSVLLGSLAYDIALSIREAQVYGLSVKQHTVAGVGQFQIGYGIHFASNN